VLNSQGPRGPPSSAADLAAFVPENAAATCKYIDTHIHVEYVLQKLKYGSWKQFITKNTMPHNFEACISIFCDPAALSPSFGLWRDLVVETPIYAAFGCHPHNAKYYNDALESRFVCLEVRIDVRKALTKISL
jgi:TatD DNase family protein